MELHRMGIQMRHDAGFVIDRPNGTGDYLLLIFKTDALVWQNEVWNPVRAGSFLLYRRNMPQKYAAAHKEYCNHYLHFDMENDGLLDRLAIRTDAPAMLLNMEEIETFFRLLSREQISDSSYREENTALLIELLLHKLAENQCDILETPKECRYIEELTELRSELYSSPARYKSIREMAASRNLSLSYFQALYRECFGVSCYEDLLDARIQKGKDFLAQNELSIREIAFLCGYENDTCFMRSFKKRTDMTPTEFRDHYLHTHKSTKETQGRQK